MISLKALRSRSFLFALAGSFALTASANAQDSVPPKRGPDSASVDSLARHQGARPSPDSLYDSVRAEAKRHGVRQSKHHRIAEVEEKPVWPVKGPEPLPGSILPAKRIVAFYGNPFSKRMGILGALPPEKMLARLDTNVAKWTAADSTTPVQPALHLIASVAQASPGRDGTYSMRMDSAMIEKVYGWARSRGALLFLDLQLGKASLDSQLRWIAPYLARPDVHLALDPEFAMTRGGLPGKRIGTLDARDVNRAIDLLADLVTRYNLPPKVLIVHRFRGPMLTHYKNIKLDPRVQVVIDMDGWGPPWMKRESYRRFVYENPVQYTGFKLFFHNDTKGGDKLMTPKEVLGLFPVPLYIQYQ